MSEWKEPRSDYGITDEVLPEIFNTLAENEKYLKEVQGTKITTADVQNATINSSIAGSRTNLADNEVLKTGFGKIRKWFSDLKALAFLDTVGTSVIDDLAITTGKIANAAVTTAKIADSAITTGKIANGNVTTAKVADSAITTAKIANGAVTSDKIDSVNASKISGTVASATNSTNSTNANLLKGNVETSANTPSNYNSSYQGLRLVVIANSTISLSTGGSSSYSYLLVITPTSTTYGYTIQVAYNSDGVYVRRGTNSSSWTSWSKLVEPTDFSTLETSFSNIANNTTKISNSYGGFAAGSGANATATNAIQLGSGTNSTANTLNFMGYQLVNASGKIPNDRLSLTVSDIPSLSSLYVALTGNQTVAGVKTFSSSPKLSTNSITTSSGHAVSIPNVASTLVNLASEQTISALKIFNKGIKIGSNWTITTSGSSLYFKYS